MKTHVPTLTHLSQKIKNLKFICSSNTCKTEVGQNQAKVQINTID